MAYKEKAPLPVSEGGTGDISLTAYAVLCGGTTSTGAIQSIAGLGSSGQVLTSNGAGALPTFQPAASSSITLTGDSGGGLTGTSFTFTAAGASKAGVTCAFAGAGTTLTLNVTDSNGNTLIGGGKAVNSGSANAGVGQSILGNCTGNNNLATGDAALFALTSGTDNAAVGFHSLYGGGGVGITTGSYNIGIGSNAGSAYTSSESSNILLNSSGVLAESNVLRIGSATGTGNQQLAKAFICGIDGVNVGSTAKVVTESSNQLGTATITAGTGITIGTSANTITVNAVGSGVSWSVITANQTAAVNNGYFCNKAGTLALALPTSSAVGDTIEVVNINTATGIQFTQAAGQQIFVSTASTTLGATGTLTSSAIGDSIKLVCSVANTTWWASNGIIGNWTPA